MATDVQSTLKDMGNTFYNGVLLALGTVASRYVSTKMLGFKDRPIEAKAKSVGMLALDLGVGSFLKDKAQDMGVPKKIFN
jgi:hypothetical protein